MKVKLGNKRIYIEESVIIVIFVCLFSKVARNYLEAYYLCFLFIVFHELSHVVVAALLGSNVKVINIKLLGLSVILEKTFLGLQAVLVYLAGPLSNILLAILFVDIKVIFEINTTLALVNLLPIAPLDGFNILNVILEEYLNKNLKRKVLKIVTTITEITLIVLGIILSIVFCNISLLILLLYIKMINLNSAK